MASGPPALPPGLPQHRDTVHGFWQFGFPDAALTYKEPSGTVGKHCYGGSGRAVGWTVVGQPHPREAVGG